MRAYQYSFHDTSAWYQWELRNDSCELVFRATHIIYEYVSFDKADAVHMSLLRFNVIDMGWKYVLFIPIAFHKSKWLELYGD